MNIRLDGSTSIDTIKRLLASWSKSYSPDEEQYKYIKPRFFIETVLDDKYTGKSAHAVVFMVRCIHGKPVNVRVRKDAAGRTYSNTYDLNFKQLMPSEFPLEKPTQWESMLAIAAKLSAPFEFVRMDFYICSDENIYLSEYTFTPSSGNRVFSMALEHELGRLWR